MAIDPRAVISPGAKLAPDVSVGAFSMIGPDVEIGAGTTIGPHVVVAGHTRIGTGNRIFQFASIGDEPQDKKYKGEPTRLEIGDRNVFREFTTINRGTTHDKGVTRIGHDNLFMAYTHVAHDCTVGSHVVMANVATLGGHVEIGDHVIMAGLSAVHQFCKIGAHAMTGVGSVVLHDVPPFVMVSGNTAQAHGINTEGLRRRGFSAERIAAIRRAYRVLYKDGLTLAEARAALGRARDASLDPQAEAAADLDLLAGFLDRVTRGIVR